MNYTAEDIRKLLNLALATGSAYGDKMDQANADSWIKENFDPELVAKNSMVKEYASINDVLKEYKILSFISDDTEEVPRVGILEDDTHLVTFKPKGRWAKSIHSFKFLNNSALMVAFKTTYTDEYRVERHETAVYRVKKK